MVSQERTRLALEVRQSPSLQRWQWLVATLSVRPRGRMAEGVRPGFRDRWAAFGRHPCLQSTVMFWQCSRGRYFGRGMSGWQRQLLQRFPMPRSSPSRLPKKCKESSKETMYMKTKGEMNDRVLHDSRQRSKCRPGQARPRSATGQMTVF